MEPERILIVEDDTAFADYLRRGLTYEGYEARVVTAAEWGLTVLRALEPRASILDIMLPGMDGMAACRTLRQSGYAGPVLMLTACDSIGDRVAGLDSGTDDYLPKPFEFDYWLRSCARAACVPVMNCFERFYRAPVTVVVTASASPSRAGSSKSTAGGLR